MAKKRFTVYLPNGKTETILYDENTDKKAIVERLTHEWEDFCMKNWLNSAEKGLMTAEDRVKRFMNCLAEFLLKGEPNSKEYPILTEYKQKAIAQREVVLPIGCYCDRKDGLSELMAQVENAPSAFAATKGYKKNLMKKEPTSGSFTRLARIVHDNPDVVVDTVPIDTENEFVSRGKRFRLSNKVTKYLPVETDEGLYYALDKICVGWNKRILRPVLYIDQYGYLIENKYVTEL